jgi:hypothetical protein
MSQSVYISGHWNVENKTKQEEQQTVYRKHTLDERQKSL